MFRRQIETRNITLLLNCSSFFPPQTRIAWIVRRTMIAKVESVVPETLPDKGGPRYPDYLRTFHSAPGLP